MWSQISNQNIFCGWISSQFGDVSSACSEWSLLPCHNIIHGKQRGIENRRKIVPYCSQMQCNNSKQLHVMFCQLHLVILSVFSAVELLRLNPIKTLISVWKTPFIECKYYAWATCSHWYRWQCPFKSLISCEKKKKNWKNHPLKVQSNLKSNDKIKGKVTLDLLYLSDQTRISDLANQRNSELNFYAIQLWSVTLDPYIIFKPWILIQ